MSIEYSWIEETDCALCAAHVPVAEFNDPNLAPYNKLGTQFLCELCTSTHASSAYWYRHNSEDRLVVSVICGVGNAILEAMGKFGPRPVLPESDDGR